MARRIETQTSRTAEFTCLARCLSYLEKRKQFKSEDYISLVIMNSLVKFLIKLPFIKHRFLGPLGMYEYVISRTKYIDSKFVEALRDGTEQILILGAGFDSRGIRFGDSAKDAKVFELDAPATQTAKINRYKERGIKTPDSLVFIPIDFDKQTIPDRLSACGFERGKKCLFIMEGLTMYLKPESVANLFKIIHEYAGDGSRIVFDFIYDSVLRGENLYEGEKELYESVSSNNEGFCFGIEKGTVDEFLAGFGFEALEIMNATRLEDMYFRDESGKPVAKVNGTHCLVTARKRAEEK